MSHAVEQMFTRIGPRYDVMNHVLTCHIDRYWRWHSVRQVSLDVSVPIHVADWCCGTFDSTIEWLKRFPHAMITAIDFSEGMLRAGRTKLARADSQKRVTVIQGDVLESVHTNTLFDVIYCAYGWRNLDSTDQALNIAYQQLKPGGHLMILDFFRPDRWFARLFQRTFSHRIIPAVGQMIARDQSAYRYLHDSITRFLTRSECENEMTAKGFRIQKSHDYFGGVTSLIVAQKPV